MSRVVTLPPKLPLPPDGSKPGGWWHQSDDTDRIICDLCPRACSLKDGDRGFCFVRENRDGQMLLTTYGRSTGFCIDPIEKKPLNHFYPGTSVLSFGTAGCNLGCKFCQNWSISKSREVERLSESATPAAIAAAARQWGSRSVAFTYNDPIIWAEYAIDVARACRAANIKTVAVTAGYITETAREPFFAAMDAANVDLKAFSEEFYQQLTLSHLQPVLDTLAWLKHETDVWFEITNLVIPRANDSDDEMRRMCDWVFDHVGDDVPMHFSAFHPDFRLRDRERTPPETLLRGYQLARAAGLKYVYVGNVNDAQHQSTYCSECNGMVIERDWYALGAYHLDGNRCRHCGAQVAGLFEDAPGSWERKRQPIQISQFAPQVPVAIETESRRNTVSTAETSPTDLPQSSSRPELTDDQKQIIHRDICEQVIASVLGFQPNRTDASLAGAAQHIVLGCFVTLKRQDRLRACCGFLGRNASLAAALSEAAVTTATRDMRLPAISPIELPYLNVDVSLLHSLQPVKATGDERVKAVKVGTHGLQIARDDARGLLLPSVATKHDLDAAGFLRQVCLKANLPPTAWKEPGTQLWTFEGLVFGGAMDEGVLGRWNLECPPMFQQGQLEQLAQLCRANVLSIHSGATPTYYLPNCPDGTVQGITITLKLPDREEPARFGRISLRPGMPLQSTLMELSRLAAGMFAAGGFHPQQLYNLKVDVAVLHDAAMHGTVAQQDLAGMDPTRRAVLVSEGNKNAWIFDPSQSAQSLVAEAAKEAQVRGPDSASIHSFEAASTQVPITSVNLPKGQEGGKTRQPAVAGMFYPGEPDELAQTVDDLFPKQRSTRQPWRAAMVPHAGLKYSGRIAAAVFDRIDIPDTVIVIGPKHTRMGVEWAVAPHGTWTLPGITVASDEELAKQLADTIADLELDAGAHAREHGIEVELPLLAKVAPEAKVVGIAIGGGDLDRCRQFADGLANVIRAREGRTLLVISSDMNHYANDEETRRVDEIAMGAIETLNPEEVYHTVRDNYISMCGVLPAVMVLDALTKIEPLSKCERVAYGTSADTTGDTSRVVGYAGMLFQ